MYKAVIFDLDGTLLNTLNTISYFANKALNNFGFASFPQEDYKYMVGNGAKILVERMLTRHNAFNEDTFNKVYNEYTSLYDRDFTYKTVPYEGIMQLTQFLKENNFILGIVSNKPIYPTVQVVNEIFGENFFNEVLGQREGIPIKPDPVSVLEILNKYNIKPEECIYVGDTGVDMLTGKNTGAFTVGVTWGFRSEEELLENGADLIINSPKELSDFLCV